jgi:mono/diheme cytochrome c family protein
MPACVHDPFTPIDPGPIDTTGMPIDTMDVDTTLGVPCDTNVVYFTKDVLPILTSNCAKSGCHDVISPQEDIILDNYQNVMASGVVEPFNLTNSDLYESITETKPDKRMPAPPNEKLTNDQISILAKWILQGAKDLNCDETVGGCDTTFVSYATFVAPVIKTNCVGCHSGASPSGNISLNSHAAVQSFAFNGRLLGAITWAYGYKPMPQGTNKLSDCKINKIKAWINDGAQNN